MHRGVGRKKPARERNRVRREKCGSECGIALGFGPPAAATVDFLSFLRRTTRGVYFSLNYSSHRGAMKARERLVGAGLTQIILFFNFYEILFLLLRSNSAKMRESRRKKLHGDPSILIKAGARSHFKKKKVTPNAKEMEMCPCSY
jgi:hypothetical protein